MQCRCKFQRLLWQRKKVGPLPISSSRTLSATILLFNLSIKVKCARFYTAKDVHSKLKPVVADSTSAFYWPSSVVGCGGLFIASGLSQPYRVFQMPELSEDSSWCSLADKSSGAMNIICLPFFRLSNTPRSLSPRRSVLDV